ncbi:MAG: pseudouridine synthase, partial [Bacilli bacterium]
NKVLKKPRKEYYLLYKPKNTISSSNDEKDRLNVVALIDTKQRIYPVGRLDYDTTGLLILTNDGAFTNAMASPSSKVGKIYLVYINGVITSSQIKELEKGVIIDGYKTKPAKVKLVSKDVKNNNSRIKLTLYEGKNHQVKKMIKAIGLEVKKLHREQYGHLQLKGLEPGMYRKITLKEVSQLLEIARNGYLDY